jgi:galactonate dehydratase
VVSTSPDRTWLFVEVETDGGLVGLGEGSQNRNDFGVVREVEALRERYLGQDPLDFVERSQTILDWPYIGRTRFAAVSALEQALWDLAGKHLGVPVYQLLGGRRRDRVRAYANIGYALPGDAPSDYARIPTAAAADGFTALKFYPFGLCPADEPGTAAYAAWIERGVERVRAVREAVGPGVNILVDLMHQLAHEAEALDVARRLAPLDIFWLEDPFPTDDAAPLRRYRDRAGTRIAGGAPHLRPDDFRPLLEHAALDVAMPDIKWIGGILAAKKAAAMAQSWGMMCSPHNASGPVACAASVHLSFTLSNFLILEYAWGAPTWRADLCRRTERLEGGCFPVPSAPGLGIELDWAVVDKHRVPIEKAGR